MTADDRQLIEELHSIGWDDEAELDAFAAKVDALDAEREKRLRQPAALMAAALWYAEMGVPVFPLMPRAKVPFPGSNGFKDATTDAKAIREWWQANPYANVGIATGHVVDGIDVDGPEGYRSLVELRDADVLPEILGVAITPRGKHLYVAASGDGNGSGLKPGIDYRGKGGYLVAPPSMGSNGTGYRWAEPLRTGSR